MHGATSDLSAYERRLRQTAIDLSLDVEFLGFQPRDALAEHYAWAHVLATPSIFADPCPLVVLEGMAHGLGILSTGRGGIREEAGDAGLIIDATAQGVAAGIRSLLCEPTLISSLSTMALRRAAHLRWTNQYDALRQAVEIV